MSGRMADDVKDRDAALRRREQQLAEAQRQVRVGTLERDYKTGKEIWTDEIYRIFEIERSTEPNVDHLIRRVHPDDRERLHGARAMAFETGQPFELVIRVIVHSGREKILKISGQVILEDNAPAQLLVTIQDITDETRAELEVARRARQQAALAQIGQIALSNATLSFMFAQAAETMRNILECDFTSILKLEDDHLLLVSGAGWPVTSIGTTIIDRGRRSHAGYAFDVREAVVVDDFAHETRFVPSALIRDHQVVSGGAVAIECGDERPWGVIAAYSRKRGGFSTTDVDFLRAISTTLGQAIERRRAEVELRVRAIQQSAIAEMSRRVLTSDVDQPILERACELIMTSLGVEFASFLQSDDDGRTLRFRAGTMWRDPATPEPMHPAHAAYALRSGESVTISDYAAETRFPTNLYTPYGIRVGIAAPVVTPTRKLGVLTAHTRSKKHFSAGDIHFMESLAAVFGDALMRERAKRDLVESEARYRTVVHGASEVIFTISTTGKILSLNPAFEAITGWRTDEWIGRRFGDLIAPDQKEPMRALLDSVLREPRPVQIEVRVRGKDRGEILLAAAVSPKVQRGEVVELYGFARDVTEERRFEEERNRLTHQLTLILDSTDEGIYATDVLGRCTLVNRSAAKMLSSSPDWLIGADMHALVHPRSPEGPREKIDECGLLAAMRKAESLSSRDDMFCRADGTPFPVEYTASPIIDRGEVAGTVVAFNDLSARRKLESKLEQANRLSSLGRLAATVAHEFNNVLMGISPFADVLRRETMSERGQVAVEQITRSVKRGKRITEDILRFTQPSEPVLAVFDAAAWLQTVALEARSLIGTKYTIEVTTPPDPVRIVGDSGQLHQSLINLILNARDAMPSGGAIIIRLAAAAKTDRYDFGAVEHPDRYAHLVVEDSGHGMAPETLRHIFEPLFTTKKNGTGLGLAVARHVVGRHGGEIFVESAVGGGTKFHLFIPLAQQDRATVVPNRNQQEPTPRKYRRVLIVEDERPVAAGLSSLLELEGITTTIVETGREVIGTIESWQPDAVVLDICLPDIDGVAVYAEISLKYPNLPVVFSSGHGDEALLEPYLARPHVAFLLKPYEVDTLLATLDRVVT